MKNGLLKTLAMLLILCVCSFAVAEDAEVLTGTAQGFGGTITTEVIVDAEGKIVGLTLTGDDETPTIGGTAMETLTTAILENGSLDGVDAVASASVTSNGVFAAIQNALGIEAAE